MAKWKKIESRKIANSSMFELKEHDIILPDENKKTYTLFEMPDFAAILPIYNNMIVFIKNYRYPVDKKILEIPAGFIEKNESPEETAERELEEETGYIFKRCKKLCEYHPVASLNDQTAYLFYGEVKKGGNIDLDEGEDIDTKLIPIPDAYRMLDENDIEHPHTQIALYRAEKFLTKED